MEELPGPFNRILERMEGDEAHGLLEYQYVDEDGDLFGESPSLPVFGLRPGVRLWQLNDAGPESLWDFIESHPGMIKRFSETC